MQSSSLHTQTSSTTQNLTNYTKPPPATMNILTIRSSLLTTQTFSPHRSHQPQAFPLLHRSSWSCGLSHYAMQSSSQARTILHRYTQSFPSPRITLFIKTSHHCSQPNWLHQKSLSHHQPRIYNKLLKTELSVKMYEKLHTNPQSTKTPTTNRTKIFRMSYIKNRCLTIIPLLRL
ncbi:hypothetical protein BWD162_012770 [Bartonella sp. WD16.2]|nr:hypothetical protein BWD162_012770 [Bartonella sp. WD16.2]